MTDADGPIHLPETCAGCAPSALATVLRRSDLETVEAGCRALTPVTAPPPPGPAVRAAGAGPDPDAPAAPLAVELDEQRHQLGAGDAIRFDADQPHALVNDSARLAVAYLVTSGGSLKAVSTMADNRPLTGRPL